MSIRKAIVVGAGAAGLTAGWRLAQAGWQVEILGPEPTVGGLLAAETIEGWPCDLGAHRLHPPALAVPAVAELAGAVPLRTRQRRGRVVLGGRQFDYPLGLLDLARGLGPGKGGALLVRLLQARALGERWEHARQPAAEQDAGFADFVRSRVGEGAYQMFYRPYAEKVWGLDPAELSQSCAKQRASTTAPWRLLFAARRGEFLYPEGGFGAWMGGLQHLATAQGAVVRLGQPRMTHPDLRDLDADAVVHTGHLSAALTPAQAQAAALEHRGLFLIWLVVPTGTPGEVDTWYTPDQTFWFGRVSEVARFLARGPGEGRVLCVEIPQGRHPESRDFTQSLDELRRQLDEAGILAGAARVTQVVQRFVPAVYPLFRRGWLPRWRTAVHQACASGHLWPAGRQGLWLHCNIDHAMGCAEEVARRVAAGEPSTRWPLSAERWREAQVRD